MDFEWTGSIFDIDKDLIEQHADLAELPDSDAKSQEHIALKLAGRAESTKSSEGHLAFELPEIPEFDPSDPVYAGSDDVVNGFFDIDAYGESLAIHSSTLEATTEYSNQTSVEGASASSSPMAASASRKRASPVTTTSARKRLRAGTPEEVRDARSNEAGPSPRDLRQSSPQAGSRALCMDRALSQELLSGVSIRQSSLRRDEKPIPARPGLPLKEELGASYQYEKLNSFRNPLRALRVIDPILATFHELVDEVLEQALHEELQREQLGANSFSVYPGQTEQELQHEDQPQRHPRLQQPEFHNPFHRQQKFELHHDVHQQAFRQELRDPETSQDLVQRFEQQLEPDQRASRENSVDSLSKARMNRRRRTENIRNFDPCQFYHPLRYTPKSWGSIHLTTCSPLFRYNPQGELLPKLRYTATQILEYIEGHPLHWQNGTKHSGLRLWVQIAPADSGKRYGSKESSQCRFADCPIKHNTICKGEYRIAFDENSHNHDLRVDPYHCAGYAHLFCMEKFLDFPQICKTYNVIPDARIFREGKNKMAITRDYPEMGELVKEFIEDSMPWSQVFGNYGRPENWYEGTLSYTLIQFYLKHQPGQVESLRDKRGGNSIDIHMGNLDIYAANEDTIREKKKVSKKNGEKLRKVDIMREVIGGPAGVNVVREE